MTSSRLLIAAAVLAATFGATTTVSASAKPATPVAVAATTGATGNATSIAIETKMAQAYTHVRAVIQKRTGDLSYNTAGPTGAYNYADGQAAPSQNVPARETMAILLKGGIVVGFTDIAKAKGTPTLKLIETSAGSFGTVTGCYSRTGNSLSSFSAFGQPFSGVFGNFSAPRHRGNIVSITVSYPWGHGGAIAHEVDNISVKAHLMVSSTVSISASSASPALSFTSTFSVPKKVPVIGVFPTC